MGITAQNALEKLAKNLAYYATETALNELLQELSIDAAPPHKHGPDYVFTSDFPSIRRAGHGRVWATATASLGTIDAMSDRRLKRYCTSAK